MVKIGEVIVLDNGRKGKVIGILNCGEYVIETEKGGQIIYFDTEKDTIRKNTINTLKQILSRDYDEQSDCNEEALVLKIAIKELEKQIAKKPREKHYEGEGEVPYIKYKCPSCDGRYSLCDIQDKYCKNCGQKIDWS